MRSSGQCIPSIQCSAIYIPSQVYHLSYANKDVWRHACSIMAIGPGQVKDALEGRGDVRVVDDDDFNRSISGSGRRCDMLSGCGCG